MQKETKKKGKTNAEKKNNNLIEQGKIYRRHCSGFRRSGGGVYLKDLRAIEVVFQDKRLAQQLGIKFSTITLSLINS